MKEIILILLSHWIADFVCQSDKIAKNKSKSNKILFWHIVQYIAVMYNLIFWSLLVFGEFSLSSASALGFIGFILLNGVLHFVIDYFTSRLTSYYFNNQMYHEGFVIVGLDQFLHTTLLIVTYNSMVSKIIV